MSQCQCVSTAGRCFPLLFLLLLSLAPAPSGAAIHIPEQYNRQAYKQPPNITSYSPDTHTAFSSDDITLTCEASGLPPPTFRWEKDGEVFDPQSDPRLISQPGSGTFSVASGNGHISKYQGKYRCYAANELGTAMTNEIQLITESPPKWQKERINPAVVEEGDSVVLMCNPPQSTVPPNIHWMDMNLKHIEESKRVTKGHDGNLYFSNVLDSDSRDDYICHAQFLSARTILQKEPIRLNVTHTNAMKNREPKLLLPKGSKSSYIALKGKNLTLECIAEGLPTPVVRWERTDGDLSLSQYKLSEYHTLLQLINVTHGEDGEYKCTASNHIGSASHMFTVTVQAAPYWSKQPQNQLYAPGETVKLDCKAEGIPTPTLSWRINGIPLEETDDEPRRTLRGGSLVLKDVQPGDTAVYQCEATNEHGTILTNTYIYVVELPAQILTPDKQKYKVVEGQTANLTCNAFGSPKPQLTWERLGVEGMLVSEPRSAQFPNGSLLLSNASLLDSGNYICSVDGSNASITAQLEVHNRTVVEVRPVEVRLRPEQNAVFQCEVVSDTLLNPPQIIWKMNGNKISESDDSDKYTVGESSLTVVSVQLSDEGVYTCNAVTDLDYVEARASLTIEDRPDPPSELQLSDEQDRSVTLDWIPGDSHNSPVTEFVVEFEELRLGPGTWHVLRSVRGGQSHTVLPLEPFATYRFRVIAINDLGKSEPSAPSDSITTPPAVPDTNPSNVRGNGTAEDNMVIDWEELAPLQHNAPGFQYKVMWREAGHGSDWHVNYTAMPPFKVMGTPTFTQYDIAVQAVNTVGLGPPPNITSGYSGEGLPQEAPASVGVEMLSATSVKVVWSPVEPRTVRGFLLGYKIYIMKLEDFSITHAARRKRQSQRHKLHGERERGRERRGEAEPEDQDRGGKKGEREEHVYTVPGSQTEKQVDDLRPFSRYRLEITAFNSRGEGPASEGDTFKTPESVPGKPQALRFESPSETVLVVHWAPPRQINGVLRGYRLQYQKIVDSGTSVGADLKLNASVSHYTVAGLDSHGRYRFTLAAMTTVGEGPAIMQDVDTILDGVPPYNISMSEGETLVNVSWEQGRRYRNLPFHICYKNKNVQERCTERLNTTQGFYQLGGLQPGSTYTLSFNYMNSTDFWKTVVQTKGPGLAEVHGGFATQGWFIGLISAIVLLLLVLLILCFIKRSKGGKYSVKDKEEAHVDSEARPMKDETFGEYSDNEEKRSCVSQRSLSGEVKALGSVDSLAEYGDSVDAQFNEDGSFIGQYSGKRESAGVAGGSSGNASPINPVPPFAPGPLD